MGVSGNELVWLKSLVRQFYEKNTIVPPYDVSRREFGYGSIKKIDNRNLGFENGNELNAFLRNQSPLYVSASVSEFLNPAAQPISTKGLVGSDLIFEFDADDLRTDCKTIHDSWSCPHCGASGKGRVMKCTTCAKGTILNEWVCEACLNEAKQQTFSLLNILQNDFGFDEKTLFINFSGSKGYHIHVRSPVVYSLPKSARAELANYLSLFEVDLSQLGFSFDGKLFRCPPLNQAHGHALRILRSVLQKIESAPLDEWMVLSGLSPRTLQPFLEDRARLTREVQSGVLPALPGKKTEPFWNAVLSSIVDVHQLRVDKQVSTDIHRLIRVPNTIHGSTGFLAKSISVSALKEFDPFSECVAFSFVSERKLLVHHSPKIRIGTETLDPLSESEVTVSGPLAAYLVGWGAASLR
ncbi:MAG: DNA primase small subunit domain-containing protein [archaeon]